MRKILEQANKLYSLEGCIFTPVSGHEGGRNRIFTVIRGGNKQFILRISAMGDRSRNDYLAETEFVLFLAENGAPVADVVPSAQGRLVECIEADGDVVYVSLFDYAKVMSFHTAAFADIPVESLTLFAVTLIGMTRHNLRVFVRLCSLSG